MTERTTRTTAEERDRIVARAREQLENEGGIDIQRLVAEFDRNYDTIKTVLTRLGVIEGSLHGYSLKNKGRDAEIVRLYTEGPPMKLYEVAQKMGISQETVRKVLRKNGVKILPSALIRTPEELAAAGEKISVANKGRRFY